MNYRLFVGQLSPDEVQAIVHIFQCRLNRIKDLYAHMENIKSARIVRDLSNRIAALNEIATQKIIFEQQNPSIIPVYYHGKPIKPEQVNQSLRFIKQRIKDDLKTPLRTVFPEIATEVDAFKEFKIIQEKFECGELSDLEFQLKVLPLIEKINLEDLSK